MNSYLDNACKTIWFSLCMINNSICRVCNNCSNRILLIESLNVLFNLCFISFHLCLSDKPVNWFSWRSGQEMYRDLKISWFGKKIFFFFSSQKIKLNLISSIFLWFTSRLNLGCLRSSDWSIRLDFFGQKWEMRAKLIPLHIPLNYSLLLLIIC